MTTPAAIDKLVLHAKRDTFRIHDLHGGLWAHNTVRQELGPNAKAISPWGVDAQGTPIYGQVQAQVDIGSTIIHLSANGNGLKVTTNPDKWHSAWMPTATAAMLPAIRDTLVATVGRFASVDVGGMATQHIDLCRQAELSDHPLKYADAMRSCPPPRKEAFPEPGGIRYGTGKQAVQTCFYGVAKRAAELDGIEGLPDNLARLEPRMNNGKTISRYLKVGTLRDLVQLQDADLSSAYAATVNAEVFRLMPATAEAAGGQLFIPYAQGIHELNTFVEHYAAEGMTFNSAFRHYVLAMGVDRILERFGSFPAVRSVLQDRYNVDRRTAWRIVRTLQADYRLVPRSKERGRNVASYLQELQDKFTAAA